jgi:hypothetical protein
MTPRIRSVGRLAAAIVLGSALWGVAVVTEVGAQAQPPDQLTVAFDVSIAPSFLEPAETPGIGTPFVFLYALHDALVKPLPGNDMARAWPSRGRRAPTASPTSSSSASVSGSTTATRSPPRT